MQGPREEDFNRSSARSSHKVPDHVRAPKGFHQDLIKSFSQDLELEHHARTLKRISQDRHKRTNCCCSGSGYKNFLRTPHKSFIQASRPARTSQRGSKQDLRKIFCEGLVQDHARTSWRGIQKDLHKSPFMREVTITTSLRDPHPGILF